MPRQESSLSVFNVEYEDVGGGDPVVEPANNPAGSQASVYISDLNVACEEGGVELQ